MMLPRFFYSIEHNRKVIGATTSRSSTMRLATIPYTNTPKNGNPDSYLVGMFKTDPINQRTNTTKSIFNDSGIGFQPVCFFIDYRLLPQLYVVRTYWSDWVKS